MEGFRTKNRSLTGVIFIAPALIIVALLTFFPYVYNVWMSFQKIQYGTSHGFSGLENYIKVFQHRSFRTVLINQIIIIVASGCAQFLLGFSGALVLNHNSKFMYILRSAILIPWLVPGVVCGLLWKWIFDGNVGILNILLTSMGLCKQYIPWLSEGTHALICVILVNVWRVFPFMMVMYLSGLQSIPSEQYEAAMIDGANSRQQMFFVTLPNMKPIIGMTLILSSIWNFKIFDVVWTLTGGGPAGATEVFSTLVYKSSFQEGNFGFSSAVAVIMAFAIAIPIWLYLRLQKEQ